jgi:hypothetical protein
MALDTANLSVIYVECRYAVSVTNKPIMLIVVVLSNVMLSVVMLNVVVLNIVAPKNDI